MKQLMVLRRPLIVFLTQLGIKLYHCYLDKFQLSVLLFIDTILQRESETIMVLELLYFPLR